MDFNTLFVAGILSKERVHNLPKLLFNFVFLECSDRVTALIRIIMDDALHI